MQLTFAVREADYLRADSLYRKLPPPRSDTLQYLLQHAYQTRDVRKQDEFYQEYQKLATMAPAFAGYFLLHDQGDAQAATRFAALSVADDRTPEVRSRGAHVLAGIAAEQGRVRPAFTRLREVNTPVRTKLFADLATTPVNYLPPDQLATVRSELLALDSVANGDSPAQQLRAQVRLYRLAMVSCAAGDFAAASAYAQRLRTQPTPAHWQSSMELLATTIDARIDIENGRNSEGLRKLEQLRTSVAWDVGGLFSWGGATPMWRAEALFRAQRYEEAEQWFDNLDDAVVNDIPHVAYIMLRRAQIADARNQSEKARDLYARFLKLWSNPDPELLPVVNQARSRLAALQATAG